MQTTFDGPPLAPRIGGELRVLVLARTGTARPDARGMDDQIAPCEKFVRDRSQGRCEYAGTRLIAVND